MFITYIYAAETCVSAKKSCEITVRATVSSMRAQEHILTRQVNTPPATGELSMVAINLTTAFVPHISRSENRQMFTSAASGRMHPTAGTEPSAKRKLPTLK